MPLILAKSISFSFSFICPMAVTLQTLILTPRPSKMLSSWHRNSHFRASGSLRFSPFVTFSPGRSISRPIRACRPSDQDFASSKGLNWAKPLLKIAADNFLPLGNLLSPFNWGAFIEPLLSYFWAKAFPKRCFQKNHLRKHFSIQAIIDVVF